MTTDTTTDGGGGTVLALMRAGHHAYCRDTGCFDGDDISHPELQAEIESILKRDRDHIAAQGCPACAALHTLHMPKETEGRR